MEDEDYVWTNNPATFTIASLKMGCGFVALSYMAELANSRHGSSKFNFDVTPDCKQKAAIAGDLSINFRGQIRDPWGAIEDGDLLIAPSEYEGDGLVVIEGMQKGLPMLIADIPDFRRFGLPEANYCKSTEDFILSINRFGANISALLVPNNISTQILAARSPEAVGDKWEEFLNSI